MPPLSLLAAVLFCLLVTGQMASTDSQSASRGHWLVDKFFREAECADDGDLATAHVDFALWEQLHEVLSRGASTPRLVELARGVLLPVNGVADPTFALQCPLGTAAVLQELGLQLVAQGEYRRSLRVLHLAKLFAFHKYPELGDGIGNTRWPVNVMQLMLGIKTALENFSDKGRETASVSTAGGRESSVTVVSYCFYPGGWTQLPVYSKTNKERYGQVAGIRVLHFDRPFSGASHAWMNKLLAVEQALSEENATDWILWADCDLFFMDKSFNVRKFLGSVPPEKHLVISEDANMLNSAVFFLRNNEWSRKLLKNVRNLLTAPSPFSFRDNAYHEQSPLMYLIMVPWIFEPETENGYMKEVLLVDQKMINAYPPEIALRSSFMQHAAYETGDWIISFNGCGSLIGGKICEEMWKSHFQRSLVLLA